LESSIMCIQGTVTYALVKI